KDSFRPEFLNRLSGIVVYQSLSESDAEKISRLMLADLEQRIKDKRLKIKVDDKVYSYLAKHGSSPDMGVRPMRRVVEREIEDPLADGLLRSEFNPGDTIQIHVSNGKLVLKASKPKRKSAVRRV